MVPRNSSSLAQHVHIAQGALARAATTSGEFETTCDKITEKLLQFSARTGLAITEIGIITVKSRSYITTITTTVEH